MICCEITLALRFPKVFWGGFFVHTWLVMDVVSFHTYMEQSRVLVELDHQITNTFAE